MEICWGLLKAREQMSTPVSAQVDVNNPSTALIQPAENANAGSDTNDEIDLQDPAFGFDNIDIPESWLFTDWDLFGD